MTSSRCCAIECVRVCVCVCVCLTKHVCAGGNSAICQTAVALALPSWWALGNGRGLPYLSPCEGAISMQLPLSEKREREGSRERERERERKTESGWRKGERVLLKG